MPLCQATLSDHLSPGTLVVTGSAGSYALDCASFWPPSIAQPWFLKVTDDVSGSTGNIAGWDLSFGDEWCTSGDTPLAIPDDDPAGVVSYINVCLEGFWDASYTMHGLPSWYGKCSWSLTQTSASVHTGSISCTDGVGTFSGTMDEVAQTISSNVMLNDPLRTLSVSATFSTNGNSMSDGSWNCVSGCAGSGTFTASRIESSYAVAIDAGAGGGLMTDFGDELTVPAGALSEDTTITVNIETLPAAPPPSYLAITRAYRFEPEGITFSTPVTVTFSYSEGDVPFGCNPADLNVYVFNGATGEWDLVGGTVDSEAHTVTVQLTHFSIYALFAPLDADGDGCAATEELGSNPALGGTRDPLNPYDFYDVPVPTAFNGGTLADDRDKAVSILNDVLAVLEYSGTSDGGPCNSGPDGIPSTPDDRCYNQDKNEDTLDDGLLYDRSVGTVWSDEPDGAISILMDVLLVLDQSGHSCQAPP